MIRGSAVNEHDIERIQRLHRPWGHRFTDPDSMGSGFVMIMRPFNSSACLPQTDELFPVQDQGAFFGIEHTA